MTLPTRPIEDVVADIRLAVSPGTIIPINRETTTNLGKLLAESGRLLLSQAREVAEGRAVLALHQQTLDEGAAVNKALQQRLEAVEGALREIRGMTDPNDDDSYRADDREGCLDTVFATADKALSAIQPVGGGE